MSGRRDRSRSPRNNNFMGRRRDNKGMDGKGDSNGDVQNNMMNPMMMYQGNMMMPSNMMMPNMMMPNNNMMMGGGGMMAPTGMASTGMAPTGMAPTGMAPTGMGPTGMGAGMEMMPGGTGMDMMPHQPSMEMSPIPAPPLPPTGDNMSMMGGMMMDPSMMAMYPNMGGDMSMMELKEIILKHCKLTPPSPGSQEPPRRSKPPGCRTIFVGGLPDKMRESVVREVFENYGRIHTLRLSTKNFCHIRFEREDSVDAAMLISGYRVKLITGKEEDDKDDTKATTGWLHVDYALSRDDQNEYERRQRQVMRMQEAQMQQMNVQQQVMGRSSGYRRSPSPIRIQPFSNAAIIQLTEKVKSEDHFASSLPTLITWLERGECSKKNATQFYTMIQATNSHIRRLYNEKVQSEEELQECRERVKNNIQRVIEQLEQVARVFVAATHQRVWDHFTKPQRKNIETWQKMTQEFNALKEEYNEKFGQEDMDYNGYNNSGNNMMMDYGNMGMGGGSAVSNEEVEKLKLEKESLKFQLEAYKNEVDVIKADAKKEMEKFKAQFIARQALQGFDKKPPLPQPIEKPPPPPPLPDDLDSKVHLKEKVEAGCGEAKLIGVMSAFLQVHPQGASLDYVVSYVRALFPHVSQATVHHVLQKHTDVFQRKTSGVGANIEHRWSFVAFQHQEDEKPQVV